ncbi:hypothetical protein BY458DRAFT_504588 [Sporodiniella umbellata]|nr:hypothetical protein BY458DRAFT_504588 [Sporodiniella umbellata]
MMNVSQIPNNNPITVDFVYHSIAQEYRPLPSILTDFIAFKLCELLPIRPLPQGTKRTTPELVYFILKVTTEARISCHVAVIALIYIERCKNALPKHAMGNEDTIHRIFVASLLIAHKYLQDTTWEKDQLNNARMAQICYRFYTLQEINRLEISFLKLIKYDCFVHPLEVDLYLAKHRQDLLL